MLTLHRKDLKKLPKAGPGTPQVLWTRPGPLCPSSCRHKAQYSLNWSATAKKRATNRLAISQLVHHQEEKQLTVWPTLAGVFSRLRCHVQLQNLRHAHIRSQCLPKRPLQHLLHWKHLGAGKEKLRLDKGKRQSQVILGLFTFIFIHMSWRSSRIGVCSNVYTLSFRWWRWAFCHLSLSVLRCSTRTVCPLLLDGCHPVVLLSTCSNFRL